MAESDAIVLSFSPSPLSRIHCQLVGGDQVLQAHRLLAKFREIVIEDVPLEEKVSSCGGSEQCETSFLRTIHESASMLGKQEP